MKIPKSLGAVIDALYTARQKRLAAQRIVDAMKESETALEEHLLQKYKKDDLESARGKLASSSITRKDYGVIQDFDELTGYCIRKKAFDLFQRRLSTEACQERWERGEQIPGVEKFTKIKVSTHKAGKRKK